MKRIKYRKIHRIFAAFLCVCVILALPGISDIIPVIAAGREENVKADNIIAEFSPLPEEIKEQTVSVGTDLDQLNLPEELTVYLEQEQEAAEREEVDDGEEYHADDDAVYHDKDGGSDRIEADSDKEEEKPAEDEEKPEDENPGAEEGTGEENSGGKSESSENPGTETGGGEEAAPAAEEDSGAEDVSSLTIERGSFTMPEYQSENPAGSIAVQTLQACDVAKNDTDVIGNSTKGNTGTKRTEITEIRDVTWEASPAYDSETEGVYIFTPVLPDGYALAKGVSLPEITVMVADDTQAEELRALLKLLRALPDPEEYLTYDKAADEITGHKDMIDKKLLKEARKAADDYLDKYPDAEQETEEADDSGMGSDKQADVQSADLPKLLKRLTGLEHIRDTEGNCMDFDCPYHYPQFVQARMNAHEAPPLLTLEDLIEDYGMEEPAQTYSASGSSRKAAVRAAAVTHPETYVTTEDNENNAGTGVADGDLDKYLGASSPSHPIEANIVIPEGKLPTQSCYIAVRTYDVNWNGLGGNNAEYDKLFVNGVRIGTLTGLDYDWNTSYYQVPLYCLKEGNNTVRIEVWNCIDKTKFWEDDPSSLNDTACWAVSVDWMQLVCDGGSRDGIKEFSLSLSSAAAEGKQVAVQAETVIKSTKADEKYDTEYSITDSKGYIVGSYQEADVSGGTQRFAIAMPKDSKDGAYKVQGLLKRQSDGSILAADSIDLMFIGGEALLGLKITSTLSPDTLTNKDVTVTLKAEATAEGCTDINISPKSTTATANGTYNFTVTYKKDGIAKSITYPVTVANIDKEAPVIAYEPITIREGQSLAEVTALFAEALSVTDDRKLAEEPLTYTIPTDISAAPGTKSISVRAADYAGNTATKNCAITVLPDPIKLTMEEPKAVTGSKDSYALNAVLENTGGGTITETGFVWGVIASPTLEASSGSVKTSGVVKTKGGKLSANATGLLSGVEYYARAYAKVTADGKTSVAYSDSKKFGIGIPAYGTFSVSGVSESTFTITRTGGTDGKQTVYYRTVNGSAIGGTHFTHAAGSLTFADGESSKTVTVTEKGVTTAYGGKTATSYANADRTYSLEIYRVEGGGEIDQNSRSKTRTMAKSSSYTIDRTLYTTEKSKVEVAVTSGENGKRIADTTSKQGGKETNVSFLTNRYKETNYNTNSNFSTYYTNANQKAYLNATAGGWYYRYVLMAYEYEDGYEYAYFGTKALEDTHYDLDGKKEGAAISGIPGQLWMCNFQQGQKDAVGTYYFPDTRTGGGENSYKPNKSSGTTYSYNSNTYVRLGLNDTCYLYFGSTGADKDIWYVDGLTGYALVYDETEPKCIGVAPMAGGTYLPGDPITVALVFDEIVDSANSSLNNVAINTNVGMLTYAGGADTNVLYFTGTVSSTASLSGSSALKVTDISNSGNIKDMCNLAGTASAFTVGSTNIEVDAATPSVTITAKTSGSLPKHEALVTATGAASVQYAWTQSTAMPAYGWQAVTSGTTLTGNYGTAGTTQTWYLHVLATASSGASTHKYQSFSFKQPAITGVSVRAGSTASAANVADVWKPSKYIVVQYNGTQTSGTTITFEGPQTDSQNITTTSGTKYLQVTQNGAYTITLTDSYGNVLSEHVEVKKIDAEKPTVTIQSGSSTEADVVHNAVTAVVNPKDTGGSGIAKVEYAWTNTVSTPSAWSTLNAAADGSYQTTYTATETAKTTKYLHVRVTDGAGNVSTIVRSGPYQMIQPAIGAALPTITVTGNPTAWTKSAKLTWTAKAGTGTGAGTIKAVYVPGSDTLLTTTTGTVNVTKNGNYMFTVMDSNGNTATTEVLVTKIDNEAPKLDTITAAGNITGGKTGTITLTGVTDNCSVISDAKGNYSGIGGSGIKTRQYKLAGESGWTTFSGNSFTANKNGTYTVRLTDQLGNYREYSVDMTDIDATAPEVTCTVNETPNANSGWYTASTVPVVLTFADQAGTEGGTPSGIKTVQYKLVTDNSTKPASGLSSCSVSSGTYTYSISSSYNGNYYLYYKVTDKKGNVAEGFSDLIKKDSVGSITFSGPKEGQPVSTGLAMSVQLTYGPAGGYLTAGTSASSERIATLDMYAGTGSKTKEAVYTAKNTGINYFRYYRYAVNGETGTSSSSWSFYVRQIDFNTQGGSAVESQLVWTTQASSSTSTTVQCAVTEPAAPTRTGYTFGGWYTDAACTAGNEFDFSKQVRVNTTLYAKWTANTYNVTYHLKNADGNAYTPDAAVKTYTYGQELTLPVPTSAKEGFTFSGWYDNAAYTGMAYTSITETTVGNKEYYGYFKDTQAPKHTGLNLVNAIEESAKDGWYRNDTAGGSAAVAVTGCSDNVKVTSVSVKVDGQSYTDTGISMLSAGTYQYALQEGEHSYTFKLADAAGNETTSETKTVKYDGTKPELGEITCEEKVSGFLDWIIGRESLIIHIPVSDDLSGVKSLTYVETKINETGETSETKTVSPSGKAGQQTVDLKLDADWKGKISNIVCTDRAGNVSDSKSVGTSGNIIVEDKPPVIKVTEADMTEGTAKPGNAVLTEYYESGAAPALYVSVQDESAERMGISAGIEKITYAINGEERTVSGDFANELTGSYDFIVSLDDYAGVITVTVKAVDYAGNTATEHVTVKIKGEEKAPNAAIDYREEELTGLVPDGQYKIDGAEITADAEGHIEIKEEWLGTTVSIVKAGNGSGTTDSTAQSLSIPARPAAPNAPELNSRTDQKIVLKTISDAQYRIGNGGWQDGTTFTGLTEKTVYSFAAYYPATDKSFASPESGKAGIATMPAAPAADKLKVNYTAETFTLDDGVEAFTDADCTNQISAGDVAAYMGQTLYIRYPEKGTDVIVPASAATAVQIPARPSKPAAGTTDAAYPGAVDGAITGLTAGVSYMVSPDNGGTWESRTADADGRITGLKAGAYEVYAAAGSTNFRSEAAAVTIGEKPATRQDKPDIRIDYVNRTLTGFVPGEKYDINGEELTADQSGTVRIESDWFGTTLSITRKGNEKDKFDSDAQSLSIPAIPDKPTPTGVDVQIAGGTGKLTGLTAGTTYEVSTDGGRTWKTGNADGSGEITGLAPGSYTVRVKAGISDFASEPGNPAAIGAYRPKVIFIVDGKTYDTISVDYGGTLTNIPAVPSKDSAAGDWYADEQGGSPAVFTNITADMTVYAVYTTAYTVTLQGGTGYTLTAADGSTSPVKEGGSFTFRLTLSSGYNATSDFAVKVNGVKVEPAADGSGGYTYTITDIRENKTVTAEGIEKKPEQSRPNPSGGGGNGKPEQAEKQETPRPAEQQETSQSVRPREDKRVITPDTTENRKQEDSGEPENAETPEPERTEQSGEGKETLLPEGDSVQTVSASIDHDRIVISGGTVRTGSVKNMANTSTVLHVGDGAVIVTVECKDQVYTAGVADTAAVANAVLSREQAALVSHGETIEIRIDVEDISDNVPGADREVIEKGMEEYRKEIPGLTPGMYVDLSLFVKVGAGGWNAVTETGEPIEVVIGIPDALREQGREYYIIRAHEGGYTFMSDMDSDQDTITISTDRFSSYAIAYRQSGEAGAGRKCGLCHICPTFLGICYFVWLAMIAAAILAVWIVTRKRREEKEAERDSVR